MTTVHLNIAVWWELNCGIHSMTHTRESKVASKHHTPATERKNRRRQFSSCFPGLIFLLRWGWKRVGGQKYKHAADLSVCILSSQTMCHLTPKRFFVLFSKYTEGSDLVAVAGWSRTLLGSGATPSATPFSDSTPRFFLAYFTFYIAVKTLHNCSVSHSALKYNLFMITGSRSHTLLFFFPSPCPRYW